ncbi:MAG: BglG family transcription antiterminator [Erysipelotrichaceae bacterium]
MNELTQKHINLIKILMNAKEPLSSSILSVSLGVSQKTVKTYLDSINEELINNASAHIESKSGSGISLVIDDKVKYNKYYENFNHLYVSNKNVMKYNTGDSGYLLRKVLQSNDEYIPIEEIGYELYKSRKPILKDLEDAEEYLHSYHIVLEKKTGCGIRINGKESHIRIAIADSFMMSCYGVKNDPYLAEYKTKQKKYNEVIIANVAKYGISLAKKAIDKIGRLILVSENRDKQGFLIEKEYERMESIIDTFEYECMKSILTRLKVEFTESDLNFFTVFLLSRRYISANENYDIRRDREIYELSFEIIDQIHLQTNVDLSVYSKFRLDIARHLRPMVYRLKYGIEKRSVKSIENKAHNSYYELSVIACNYLGKKLNVNISENEISYFSYIFFNHQKLNLSTYKSRVLVSSIEGKDTGNIIAYELKSNWSEYIDEVDVIDSFLLNSIDVSEYDLIVSDIPKKELALPTKSIYVNSFLSNVDFVNLRYFFETNITSYKQLISCFSPDLFIKNIMIENKEKLIDLLCTKANMFFDNKIDTHNATKEREDTLSTELINSTAVPHSFTCFSPETKIIIATLKKPILWGKEKCQLVFYVINGKNEIVPFSILSLVKEAVFDIKFVHNILYAKNFNEVLNTVKNWVENR